MAIRFIETDPETGDGYNIDDDTGDVYDSEGNQLDSGTALTPEEQIALNNANAVGNTTDDNQSDAETQRLLRYQRGESGLGNISPGWDIPGADADSTDWMKWAERLGITKGGNLDLDSLIGIAGIAKNWNNKPDPKDKLTSMDDLRARMGPNNIPAGWTEGEKAFGLQAWQPKYAEGGEVEYEEEPEGALTQAFAGAVMGDEGGQSDLVEARLSPGEYVMDAESVSALGDGNTAAGIAKLDELRRKLREHKRSAPNDQIAPEALGPLSYLQGA